MASSFVETDEEYNEELRNTSGNKNTKRSTDYWTNIFQQSAKTRGKNEQLESCEVPGLDEALAQFFAELRKENGQDCEPESIAQGNAGSFISPSKKQKLSKAVVRDTEFLSSRKDLEGNLRKYASLELGNGRTKPKA